ncbi:hypothetical protein SAMN05443144_11684 [Fodinibius roseus]|uniref:Rhodanese-like domain-containing protein n=1 Tax=Fodinibius roseus TaxID=1194090 RepID=A0A1M5G4T4_9BACT|nr:hypothetical protein SAMN05443144_11684 [Fodinibius roseus]
MLKEQLINQLFLKFGNHSGELGFSQNAEIECLVRDFRNDRQSLETVNSTDLLQHIEQKEVVVIDVRPKE